MLHLLTEKSIPQLHPVPECTRLSVRDTGYDAGMFLRFGRKSFWD